jgi:hypothetical protein
MSQEKVLPAKRGVHEALKDISDEERLEVSRRSNWFLFLRQVPVWERERIAEEIRALDLSAHDGFRNLQKLLLAEVAAGNVPPDFVKDVDPIIKNIFASIVMEAQSKGEGQSGVKALVERFTFERKQLMQVAPAYSGNVIDAPKLKVGDNGAK